jgi:uncharacterized membrane protein
MVSTKDSELIPTRPNIVLALLSRVDSWKPERVFLFLSVFCGFLMVFLTPPFQVPDEYAHFYRSYELSQGNLDIKIANMPKSVMDFTRSVSANIPFHEENKQSKKALLAELSRPFQAQPVEPIDITNLYVYSPVTYIPQAIGILIGRLLQLPPLLILYLGRLTNLAVWITLVYLAIRLTPLHPRLFAALALMPMALFLAASLSVDAATIAIGFLWLALVFRLAYNRNRPIQIGDWLALGAAGILLALCKSVYVILILAVFLIPYRRKLTWKADLVVAVLVLIAAGLAGFLWLQATVNYTGLQDADQYHMPTVTDLSAYLANPAQIFQVFWNSFARDFHTVIRTMVGVFGWLDTPMPAWVHKSYLWGLILIAFLEGVPNISFRFLEKLGFALVTVAGYVFILVATFDPQTDIPRGYIYPFTQGRYLIPFSPFFFLLFSQKRWKLPKAFPIWAFVTTFQVVVLAIALRTLLLRFYVI